MAFCTHRQRRHEVALCHTIMQYTKKKIFFFFLDLRAKLVKIFLFPKCWGSKSVVLVITLMSVLNFRQVGDFSFSRSSTEVGATSWKRYWAIFEVLRFHEVAPQSRSQSFTLHKYKLTHERDHNRNDVAFKMAPLQSFRDAGLVVIDNLTYSLNNGCKYNNFNSIYLIN